MAPVDVAVLLSFSVYALWSGLRARRQASQDLEQYFLAGRSLGAWPAGLSMAATQFAADTPLLAAGLIATGGVFALWRLWIYGVAFLLLGLVLAPLWRRAGVLTDAALVEQRYPSGPAPALRAVKAVYFGTVFNCTVLAMVLWAAKEIAEPLLTWHAWLPATLFDPWVDTVRALGVEVASAAGRGDPWVRTADNVISIGAILLLTTLYSTAGGLRGVVRTDVAQLALMLLATGGYAAWAVERVGGLGGLGRRLASVYADGGPGGLDLEHLLAFTPVDARASLPFMAVIALQWLVQMNADGTGYLAQRSMACASDRDARRASVIFCFAQVLLRSLLWLPLGLALLVLFPPAPELSGTALAADREASFVQGMAALPPGLRGAMLTAMLAALASTIDSHLNWGASYWTHDLYERFLCPYLGRTPSARSSVWVARVSNLCILTLSLAILPFLGSIQTAWQLSLMLGAGMGVMLVLRWLWWRITAAGELAAVAASTSLAPLLYWGVDSEAWRLLAIAAGSTTAGVGVSWWTSRGTAPQLRGFYARVRPPGAWAAVPGAPPDGGRRLARQLGWVALAALSCFSLLVGLGSWLIDAPAPAGFPWPAAWAPLCVALGLVLIPWWTRGARL